MKRSVAVAVLATLVIVGCGTSGSGNAGTSTGTSTGGTSTSNRAPDMSSALSQIIESQIQTAYDKANPGTTDTVTASGVSCVEQGTSESYTCLGEVSVNGQQTQEGFTGSCSTADNGTCIWQTESQ